MDATKEVLVWHLLLRCWHFLVSHLAVSFDDDLDRFSVLDGGWGWKLW
jgi:hypothetical protein